MAHLRIDKATLDALPKEEVVVMPKEISDRRQKATNSDYAWPGIRSDGGGFHFDCLRE